MTEAAPLFDVSDLQTSFGLGFGSFQIPRGRTVAILGRSGCGKSTLLDLLALNAAVGSIGGDIVFRSAEGASISYRDRFGGRMRGARRARFRASTFGYVLQSDHLIDGYSARDNVALPLMLLRHPVQRKWLQAAAERFGVGDHLNSSPVDLSGGQRSRLAALRALVHEPEVIFADEPTADLDKQNEYELLAALDGWRRERPDHRTLVFVTHNLRLAVQWADAFVWFPQEQGEGAANAVSVAEPTSDENRVELAERIATDLAYPHSEHGDFPDRESGSSPWKELFESYDPRQESSSTVARARDFVRLTYRDFVHHPRKTGSRVLTYGPPLVLTFTVFVFVCAVFWIGGARRGTLGAFERELDNPFLWSTQVAGEDFERIDPTLYEAAGGFERVSLSILLADGKQSIDLSGRSIHPDDPLLSAVARQVGGAGGAGARGLFERGDEYGILLSRAALVRLGYDPAAAPPSAVPFVFHSPPGEATTRYGGPPSGDVPVRLPVLGVAGRLPYGDFLVSEGFVQAIRSGKLRGFLVRDQFYLHLRTVPTGEDWKVFSAALHRALEHRGRGAGLDLRLEEMVREYPDGREAIYLGLSGPVFPWVVEQAVADVLGRSGRDERHRLEPAGSTELPYVERRMPYIHWNVVVHRNMQRVEAFLAATEKAGLLADSSVTWRVRSLQRTSRMFQGIFQAAQVGVILVAVIVMVIVLTFDGYRKVHDVGVLYAMGGTLGRYLWMSGVQVLALSAMAVALAWGVGNPWVFPALTRVAQGWLDNGSATLVFAVPPAADLWGFVLQTVGWVLGATLCVRAPLFCDHPAALIRFRG